VKKVNKIVVIGASGGSGLNTVNSLVEQGYEVTALSRNASKVFNSPVRAIDGSALDEQTLKEAITGQDAVVITLGISENPFRVRLFGPQRTPLNIRSEGTRKAIAMMREVGVSRLIVQTTFGSGPSKNKLRFIDKLFFDWVLKPQIKDTELQDLCVRKSALDWTIVQPVHLSDSSDNLKQLFCSENYNVKEWSVSRQLVGKFNALLVNDETAVNKTFTLSTA
jgi:putative NADH-flavin reductase